MKAATLVLVSFAATLNANATSVIVDAKMTTQTMTYLSARPNVAPRELVFTSAPARAIARVWLRPLHIGASTGDHVALGTSQWWSMLVFRFEDATGKATTYTVPDVKVVRTWIEREGKTTDAAVLHDDEVFFAACELPPLTPGDYTMAVELRLPLAADRPALTATSEYSRFSVRRGDEDADTQRAFLRHQADRVAAAPAPDRFDRLRTIMLQLTQLEPANPSVYERLADLSVGIAPPDETLHY